MVDEQSALGLGNAIYSSSQDSSLTGGYWTGIGSGITGTKDKAQFAFEAAQAAKQQDYEAQQAALSRQWSSDEAQKQRDYQSAMFAKEAELAGSAYQRAVADMKAAGINPLVAFQSGASAASSTPSAGSSAGAPTGASAHGTKGAARGGGQDPATSLISTGLWLLLMRGLPLGKASPKGTPFGFNQTLPAKPKPYKFW